ncbi:hypothetical protein NPA31_007340 [Aurantimonas sp. MSK8Z-1]|uniref:hypothetical protein n=1 Tax=Mangrovibrevibacter kandeliae TaxID=2968473 RepID=UPI00211807C0|nr:hypothetical protein [Aurantimonas sp. MSK8Z-1]MCW4114776.1 hypothetical protein [Aurantimonas sp. MSK8Z-1]
MADEPFESWAVLELMGHRRRAGFVKAVEIAGGKLLRIDIPLEGVDAVTEFYGTSAVYALRPCSEQVARDAADAYGMDPRPVRPVDYRRDETQRLGRDLDAEVEF